MVFRLGLLVLGPLGLAAALGCGGPSHTADSPNLVGYSDEDGIDGGADPNNDRDAASGPRERPSEGEVGEVLDVVYFDRNSAELKESRETLDASARLAIEEGAALVVVGRASSDETQPMVLSSRRAEAVRAYLVARGAPTSRIRIIARGAGEPHRAGGARADRSVEIDIEKPE